MTNKELAAKCLIEAAGLLNESVNNLEVMTSSSRTLFFNEIDAKAKEFIESSDGTSFDNATKEFEENIRIQYLKKLGKNKVVFTEIRRAGKVKYVALVTEKYIKILFKIPEKPYILEVPCKVKI